MTYGHVNKAVYHPNGDSLGMFVLRALVELA
jgi:hypothetical protein